jgi:TolB protein
MGQGVWTLSSSGEDPFSNAELRKAKTTGFFAARQFRVRHLIFGASSIACILVICMLGAHSRAQDVNSQLGVFENHQDIGNSSRPGSVGYDAVKKTYTLTARGDLAESKADALQFVWKQFSGDVALTADISFPSDCGNMHCKAVLMLRQNLDPDSIFASATLVGNRVAALQYRDAKGMAAHEIQSNVAAPTRLRIESRGGYEYLLLSAGNQQPMPSGASIPIPLEGPFYVGIGVSAQTKNSPGKAVFSNLSIEPISVDAAAPTTLYSTLQTIDIDTGDRSIVYVAPEHFEAPNWLRDGSSFLFNSEGHIYRLPVAGGKPVMINTGFANRCNNDHGISPDSSLLAISDQSQEEHRSIIYTVPIGGGTPRRITQRSPSYWHGWSPDGRKLTFVGERNGDFDIYTISEVGGQEKRLTTAKGLDDGPEYSPDGKYIYFNSVRTGLMQIWRMRPDGSEQIEITDDDFNNWFPHISPDGKWMVILSYDKSVEGHPQNKDVMLRLKPMNDKKITVLTRLFGGQGTINVPSWAPDSKQLAFVSYELVPQ